MTQGWWSGFFDEQYSAIGLEGTDEKREATATLVAELLDIGPGDTVFDQCCGIGRVSIPLARRGIRVIGVDQAERYTTIATQRAAGLDAEFHAGDAYDFVAPRPCDAAFNWFTSFGYHRDDRVNVRMLHRAFESLKPGGRFALEIISMPKVFAEFRSCMLDRLPQADGELWLIQEPGIDFVNGMISGTWTFLKPDGTREVRRVENRAYMPHELARLFGEAGFVDVELLGPDKAPFERTSRRLIVRGRRPHSPTDV